MIYALKGHEVEEAAWQDKRKNTEKYAKKVFTGDDSHSLITLYNFTQHGDSVLNGLFRYTPNRCTPHQDIRQHYLGDSASAFLVEAFYTRNYLDSETPPQRWIRGR